MDAATMTARVADDTGLDRDEARRAIEATLRTLAHRVTGGEAGDLAAQLPTELQGVVKEVAASSPEGERFDRDEFVRRVADDIGADTDAAQRVIQAALDVVGSTLSSGEWGDVLAQLPDGYDPLFRGDRPSAHDG